MVLFFITNEIATCSLRLPTIVVKRELTNLTVKHKNNCLCVALLAFKWNSIVLYLQFIIA